MRWDVVVVGVGHAGCEAALATARTGCRTLLLTMRLDALGGGMPRAADAAAIQLKTLNASRGPAVRATRAQCDRARYRAVMRPLVQAQSGLDVRAAHVARLALEGGRVTAGAPSARPPASRA